jgi:hypothetical protein
VKPTRTPDPADAIRLPSGLPRWRDVLYRRLVILALACLAAWSLWRCFRP